MHCRRIRLQLFVLGLFLIGACLSYMAHRSAAKQTQSNASLGDDFHFAEAKPSGAEATDANLSSLRPPEPMAPANSPYHPGDVFVGMGNYIGHYDASGNLRERLFMNTNLGANQVFGMAFRLDGNLLAAFDAPSNAIPPSFVEEYDTTGNLLHEFATSNDFMESIAIDVAGNVYVGQVTVGTAGHSGTIKKFDPAGNLMSEFTPDVQNGGINWIDIATDQCTIFYTSNGNAVKRFNVCTNTQLPDFVSGGASPKGALHMRPNGEVLVAASRLIERYDSSGALQQAYAFPGIDAEALALDPDGKHFWVGDSANSNRTVYKYDLATGVIESSFTAEGPIGGLSVFSLADTDGDALPDVWERYGVTVDSNGNVIGLGNSGNGKFIDLRTMGANPLHKDLFVHADWMDPDTSRGVSFEPDARALRMVIDSFEKAPVENPDHKQGISLHVDAGPESIMRTNPLTKWRSLSQAGSVPFAMTIGSFDPLGEYVWADVDNAKAIRFGPAGRTSIFHYALFANNYSPKRSGGISRGIPGDDFIITLGDWDTPGGSVYEQAGTFMHELGHNLGLRHGGIDDVNAKPNYLSIMNYRFQNIGVFDGKQRRFDYSHVALATLDESNLNENPGVQRPD